MSPRRQRCSVLSEMFASRHSWERLRPRASARNLMSSKSGRLINQCFLGYWNSFDKQGFEKCNTKMHPHKSVCTFAYVSV